MVRQCKANVQNLNFDADQFYLRLLIQIIQTTGPEIRKPRIDTSYSSATKQD